MDTIEARVTLVNLTKKKRNQNKKKTTRAIKNKEKDKTKQSKRKRTKHSKTQKNIIDNVITTLKEGEQSSSQ